MKQNFLQKNSINFAIITYSLPGTIHKSGANCKLRNYELNFLQINKAGQTPSVAPISFAFPPAQAWQQAGRQSRWEIGTKTKVELGSTSVSILLRVAL